MEGKKLLFVLCLCSSGVWAGDKITNVHYTVSLKYRGELTCTIGLRAESEPIEKISNKDHQNFLRVAAATCRNYNCGSFVNMRAVTKSPNTLETWLICSDYIRLVNGTNRCSGRLKVKSNQTWSSVCDSDFDRQDAEVVCRELGCGAPSLLQGASYGEVDFPTWKTEFQCEGNESHLLDCNNSTPEKKICSSAKVTELTCSDSVGLWLEEVSQCSGQIMVSKKGMLTPLTTDNLGWIVKQGNIICEHLGCGSFIETAMEAMLDHTDSAVYLWSINTSCVPSTHDITECIKDQPELDKKCVFVRCSESNRLVNGRNHCSGRLEVKSNQTWSSVCDSDFDRQDAKVVCRELGCGAPSMLNGNFMEYSMEAPKWSKEFYCTGNERHLLDCDSSTPKWRICSSAKLTQLTCSVSVELRLTRGTKCNRQVMVKKKGIFTPLMIDSLGWVERQGNIICEQLGCGSFIHASLGTLRTPPNITHYFWSVNTSCLPSTFDIRECIKDQLEAGNKYVDVICTESIRLVNGTNRCSGRLEVKTDQTWSSVCASDFNHEEAEVVCRELQCGIPTAFRGGLFGKAESPAWTGEFWCEGRETHLSECGRSNENICSPIKAVGINCSVPQHVRLIGEESHCAGTLVIKYKQSWTPVKYQWDDLMLATKVCRHLGCGSAVLMNKTKFPTKTWEWEISSSCLVSSSSVLNCVRRDLLVPDVPADVMKLICTDLLQQPNITVFPYVTDVIADPQVFHVLEGSDFTITRSAQLQYQGGFFKLLFNSPDSVHIYTLTAVNHSAQFNFSAATRVHKGHYTCVYNVHVYSHNFSAESLTLGLLVSAPLSELMIRLVIHLLGLTALISTAIFYPKWKSRQRGSDHSKTEAIASEMISDC